jgi:hypothetical protein
LLAKATGKCYGWGDALTDAAVGAAGVGLISKLRNVSRLKELRSMANWAGMQRQAAQKGVEKYVGSIALRLELKLARSILSPKGGLNPQTSMVQRARPRIANGVYADPFTGKIGTKLSDVGHIPLEVLPFTEAPAIGVAMGSIDAAARAVTNCDCN